MNLTKTIISVERFKRRFSRNLNSFTTPIFKRSKLLERIEADKMSFFYERLQRQD